MFKYGKRYTVQLMAMTGVYIIATIAACLVYSHMLAIALGILALLSGFAVIVSIAEE